jgi:hypothetical protein
MARKSHPQISRITEIAQIRNSSHKKAQEAQNEIGENDKLDRTRYFFL